MRSRALVALCALSFVVAACGALPGEAASSPSDRGPGGGADGESQAPPPEPEDETEVPPAPEGAETVVLHGTFTGHRSDPLATADLSVEVELHWNAAPDDIHDINAFTLTSGSFEFSESIGGVCGGTRSESGPLTSHSTPQSLESAELQERDIVMVSVIDQRIETGNVAFSIHGSFDVPSSDPEGCGDLDRSGVGVCALEFQWLGVGELAPEASCSDVAGEWTGRLAP